MIKFQYGDQFEILPGYPFEGEIYTVIDVDAPLGESVRVTGENSIRSVTMDQNHVVLFHPVTRDQGYAKQAGKIVIEEYSETLKTMSEENNMHHKELEVMEELFRDFIKEHGQEYSSNSLYDAFCAGWEQARKTGENT